MLRESRKKDRGEMIEEIKGGTTKYSNANVTLFLSLSLSTLTTCHDWTVTLLSLFPCCFAPPPFFYFFPFFLIFPHFSSFYITPLSSTPNLPIISHSPLHIFILFLSLLSSLHFLISIHRENNHIHIHPTINKMFMGKEDLGLSLSLGCSSNSNNNTTTGKNNLINNNNNNSNNPNFGFNMMLNSRNHLPTPQTTSSAASPLQLNLMMAPSLAASSAASPSPLLQKLPWNRSTDSFPPSSGQYFTVIFRSD